MCNIIAIIIISRITLLAREVQTLQDTNFSEFDKLFFETSGFAKHNLNLQKLCNLIHIYIFSHIIHRTNTNCPGKTFSQHPQSCFLSSPSTAYQPLIQAISFHVSNWPQCPLLKERGRAGSRVWQRGQSCLCVLLIVWEVSKEGDESHKKEV